MRTIRAIGGALMMAACSHVPTETTVAEHHRAAHEHEQRALETAFHPTPEQLLVADAELRAANAHLAASRALIAFEHRACEGLSVGERSSCPLFASTLSAIETTPQGFTLTFQDQVDVELTFRRLDCHLAYAIASGFDRPSCPLFVKGATLHRQGPHGIVFLGETEAVAAELRAQARRLFNGLGRTGPAAFL